MPAEIKVRQNRLARLVAPLARREPSRWLITGFAFLAATALLALTLPLRGPVGAGIWYRTDSGVFLYSGWRVLNGEVPYRDFWDHKGPAIYYVDALGIWIGGGTVWGVLLLEIVAIAMVCWWCYLTVHRRFGWLAAFISTIGLLSGVALTFHAGNVVEEFALPFNMAALYLFLGALWGARLPWMYIAIGSLATVPALFRPNLIGVGLAIALTILIIGLRESGIRQAAIRLGLLAGGAAITLSVPIAYFAWAGALDDLWEAVVEYNVSYASAGLRDRIDSAIYGLDLLSPAGLHLLALTGWALAATRFIAWFRGATVDAMAVFLSVAVPIELVLAALSGNHFPHYYLTVLPAMTLAFAFLLGTTMDAVRGRAAGDDGPRHGPDTTWVVCVALVVALTIIPGYQLLQDVWSQRDAPAIQAEAIAWIDEHRKPGDTVLVWGNEPSVNFFSGTPSPTKFFYQFPIFTGEHRREHAVHALADLEHAPPAFVIDSHAWMPAPLFPPLDPDGYARWRDSVQGQPTGIRGVQVDVSLEADAVIRYLQANYVPIATLEVGAVEWMVYEYRPATDVVDAPSANIALTAS